MELGSRHVKTSSEPLCLEVARVIAGLVWSIAVPLSTLFFVAAVFQAGEWQRFFSSLTVVAVADALQDALERMKERVALGAEMAPRRVSPAHAEALLADAMHAGRQAFLERAAAVSLNPASWVHSTIAVVGDGGDDRTHAIGQPCSRPTEFLFSNACRAFNDVDRAEIIRKAEVLWKRFNTVIAIRGVERVELERRRFILLLQANYESELVGDFSKSSAKAREIVLALMAAGLTLERLLERPWNRDIFAQVLTEAKDETIWA